MSMHLSAHIPRFTVGKYVLSVWKHLNSGISTHMLSVKLWNIIRFLGLGIINMYKPWHLSSPGNMRLHSNSIPKVKDLVLYWYNVECSKLKTTYIFYFYI